MKKTYLMGAAALLLAGCGTMGGKNAAADKDAAGVPANAVATVNGKAISKDAVTNLLAEINRQNPEQQVSEAKVVDSLITRELLRQEAERQNLQSTPAVAGRLENAARDALAQAAVENFRKSANVSEEDVRKEYESKLAGADMTEYKARHILVETEAQAKEVLDRLKKGAKFADLAKKVSKDPGSKDKGGDLGWFSPQQMVPEFSSAVAGLKNGETAPAPVKTQFGWHVVQREDSRKSDPPPFDAVKDQIRNILITQKLQQHVESLKSAAKIENKAEDKK